MLKFDIGDKVIIKSTNQRANIEKTEFRYKFNMGKSTHVKKYFIRLSNNVTCWVNEDELQFYGLSDEVEKQIDYLLIDINLKYRKFDMIKTMLENK